MISGQRAYSATTLHELRREHIGVTPPPLVEKIPDVPRGFSEAIDRAISKDRGNRQATAGELAAELRAGLGDTPRVPSSRTYPDIPHPQESHSHTQGSPGAITSKSDVNAATIVTVDAASTTPPSVARPVERPPVVYDEATAKVERAQTPAAVEVDLSSSVTKVRLPKPEVPLQKSRGKSLVLVGAVVLILVLVVAVVGGYIAINKFKTQPGDGSGGVGGKGKTGTEGGGVSNTAAPEVGRYWLEVLPNVLSEPQRVARPVPLVSGGAFKFHFEFAESGYVYIIGPGEKNQPTAFLTDKPAALSGVESNEVAKGNDFSFPSGLEHWLELDKKPGTEDYTIVFSTDRLAAPAFLASQATGKPLGETEQAEFREFLAKYKTSEPVVEIDEKDTSRPFVKVKVPQSEGKGSGKPVIFNIRIEHK
jgi:hypothetical protein